MWNELNDAQMRARHTVVRYKGAPVFIDKIDNHPDGLVARFRSLLTAEVAEAYLTDEGWDWSPVPTGMVNVDGKVFFVQRRPCRKYKHGLSKDNCSVFPENRAVADIFKSKQFGKTVMREYPTYAEALEAVKQPCAVAFHPQFALTRSRVGPVYLIYRTDTVGWFERGELVLADDWKFLSELVSEVTA